MNSYWKFVLGIIIMAIGIYGFMMDIGKPGHYFGTGTAFGIGLSLFVSGVWPNSKKNSSVPYSPN